MAQSAMFVDHSLNARPRRMRIERYGRFRLTRAGRHHKLTSEKSVATSLPDRIAQAAERSSVTMSRFTLVNDFEDAEKYKFLRGAIQLLFLPPCRFTKTAMKSNMMRLYS